jgi:hypothetical protein
MYRATECVISVDLAIALRDLVKTLPVKVQNGDLGMRCRECGKPVKPHAEGPLVTAHFEHLKYNPRCSLSDLQRG